jgi:hypothetical protein
MGPHFPAANFSSARFFSLTGMETDVFVVQERFPLLRWIHPRPMPPRFRRPAPPRSGPPKPILRILVDGDPMLEEAIRRIVLSYHPIAVYTIPAQSREPDPGQFDVVVLVRDDVPPEMRIPTMAYNCTRGLGLRGEVHVHTQRQFDFKLKQKDSVPSVVTRMGKLLYEHPRA